jgi:MFS family permease
LELNVCSEIASQQPIGTNVTTADEDGALKI